MGHAMLTGSATILELCIDLKISVCIKVSILKIFVLAIFW